MIQDKDCSTDWQNGKNSRQTNGKVFSGGDAVMDKISDDHRPASIHSLTSLPLLNHLSANNLTHFCSQFTHNSHNNLQMLLHSIALISPLLNSIQQVVFFIKDRQARYLMVNVTLAHRCGLKSTDSLLGKRTTDIFPSKMAHSYHEQDRQVLQAGKVIESQLEMHFYHDRKMGWCLTSKLPIYDHRQRIIGMVGISHDLMDGKANHPVYQQLATVDHYIRDNYDRTIRIEELTQLTQLSVAQLERYCKRIFHLTPRQMIHKVRIEKAYQLLTTNQPITDIALQCGYTDHSAFTRQFKLLTGLTPREFRGSKTAYN